MVLESLLEVEVIELVLESSLEASLVLLVVEVVPELVLVLLFELLLDSVFSLAVFHGLEWIWDAGGPVPLGCLIPTGGSAGR